MSIFMIGGFLMSSVMMPLGVAVSEVNKLIKK